MLPGIFQNPYINLSITRQAVRPRPEKAAVMEMVDRKVLGQYFPSRPYSGWK